MKTITNIKSRYFNGIGVLVAKEVGCTPVYVRNYLNGYYGDRDTKLTRRIKAAVKRLGYKVEFAPKHQENKSTQKTPCQIS